MISPAEVPLWTQFDIKLSLTNLASSEMQLGLEAGIQPSGQAGVVFGGLSMRSLGALQPQATMPVILPKSRSFAHNLPPSLRRCSHDPRRRIWPDLRARTRARTCAADSQRRTHADSRADSCCGAPR